LQKKPNYHFHHLTINPLQHSPMPDPLQTLADRHGFSLGAITMLWTGLRACQGQQVQFNHPELGGLGQWQPGQVMIGDMSNRALKARVELACTELAQLACQVPPPPLLDNFIALYGEARLSGVQNGLRYAYFPQHKLLVVQQGERVRKFSTAGYELFGVGQASQGQGQPTLRFSTNRGYIDYDELPLAG
jgi:hypothetical protein